MFCWSVIFHIWIPRPRRAEAGLQTVKMGPCDAECKDASSKRELDVMRVWFLRAFVVFFLDFVMFSQSFHGYSLDMFLCSCFLNKTNFSCLKHLWIKLYPSLPISILIVSKVALLWASPSTFFMKWASPSTFFMKWREDHYLETQCAHHAQQKLRNLLSSTGPG